MPLHEETESIVLLGGPLDGTELDVRPTDTEVRRPVPSGKVAKYFRHGCRRFYFDGYVSNDPHTCGVCGKGLGPENFDGICYGCSKGFGESD